MSLKVWLPLRGTLENLGASDTTVTGTSVTIDTTGKIGSCYSFGGSSNYIKMVPAPLSNDNEEFSYTCWIYPTVNT